MFYRQIVSKAIENYVKYQNYNSFIYKRCCIAYAISFFEIQILLVKKNINLNKCYFRLFVTKMSNELSIFSGSVDRYNGITIDTETESIDNTFSERLKSMSFNLFW